MERASHKYKVMTTRGTWEAPSPEDEKLLALTTTIEALKAKISNSKKSPKKAGRSRFKKSGKGKSGGMKECLYGFPRKLARRK